MAVTKCEKEVEFKSVSRLLARLNDRGLNVFPTHYKLEEFFKQAPALNAVIGLPGSDSTSPTAAALAAYTIANKDFEVLGTGATTALATLAADGGVTLTTGTSANDQMIILPHLDTKQTAWTSTLWGTENQTRFESWIKTGASIADIVIWCGLKLTNTSVIATNDDQAFFRFADADGTDWRLNTSRAGTDTLTTTGITVAASTLYRLAIEFDEVRGVKAFINGTQVAQLPAMTDAIDLIPYIGVQTTTTAGKVITAKYLSCSRAAA